jgi:hypothetical protein
VDDGHLHHLRQQHDSGAEVTDQSKHTPGPWQTHELPRGIEILGTDWRDRVCMVMFRRIGRGGRYAPSARDYLDARLIAASPQLLERLKSMLELLEIEHKRTVPTWDGSATPDSEVGRARALIASIEAAP